MSLAVGGWSEAGEYIVPVTTQQSPQALQHYAQLAGESAQALYDGPEEHHLQHDFTELVAGLSLASLAVTMPNRSLPKTIDRYRLVALQSQVRFARHSATPCGYSYTLPEGTTTPEQTGNKARDGIYLDTGLAIGLVYDGVLRAVGGAAVVGPMRVEVRQLQSAKPSTAEAADSKGRFRSGLHAGFYWRDTLVNAWLNIASKVNVDTVDIQSAGNNGWLNAQRNQQFVEGYDHVAQRLGFSLNLLTKNWQKRLNADD